MSDTLTEQFQMAAKGLELAEAQKHILALRLTRKLSKKEPGLITVSEMLGLIETAMHDMHSSITVQVISEGSYRDNQVV